MMLSTLPPNTTLRPEGSSPGPLEFDPWSGLPLRIEPLGETLDPAVQDFADGLRDGRAGVTRYGHLGLPYRLGRDYGACQPASESTR